MRRSLTKVMRTGLADTQTRWGRTQASADVVADGVVAARVTSAHPATISPATSTTWKKCGATRYQGWSAYYSLILSLGSVVR